MPYSSDVKTQELKKEQISYVNDDFPDLVDSETYTIDGTYGSNDTPTKVFVKELADGGGYWYVAEDSKNVNFTTDKVQEGRSIEEYSDIDMFTTSKPVNSEDELEDHVVEHYGYLLESES
jgi:hypothetical protein